MNNNSSSQRTSNGLPNQKMPKCFLHAKIRQDMGKKPGIGKTFAFTKNRKIKSS